MKKKSILIIDDDINFLKVIEKIFLYKGYDVTTYSNPFDALNDKNIKNYSAIITDLIMPEISGLDIIKAVKNIYPPSIIIVLTGQGSIETAVEAIKHGALTYIEKPVKPDDLINKIEGAIKFKSDISENNKESSIENTTFIGNSNQMKKLKKDIYVVAKTDATVLILGESGTGKELVADLIYRNSLRSENKLVKINCAAIPDTLLESELFGYEKGSFTGAAKEKKGKIEMAHKGTLFLDEVGELSLSSQAKLLRVIQQKELSHIGSEKSIKVDFRLICATNRHLTDRIKAGDFREDLFFRLNVITLSIPPLRNRKSDIIDLIKFYYSHFNIKYKKIIQPLDQNILDYFLRYDWPGNVRELKNTIERLFVFSHEDQKIREVDLPNYLLNCSHRQNDTNTNNLSFKDAKYEFEKKYLVAALKKNNWNITETSKKIGLSRRNLHEKINQFNLKDWSNDNE